MYTFIKPLDKERDDMILTVHAVQERDNPK